MQRHRPLEGNSKSHAARAFPAMNGSDALHQFGFKVSRYFLDFLETDFKRQQAPRRRIQLKNEANQNTGVALRPHGPGGSECPLCSGPGTARHREMSSWQRTVAPSVILYSMVATSTRDALSANASAFGSCSQTRLSSGSTEGLFGSITKPCRNRFPLKRKSSSFAMQPGHRQNSG